MFPSGILFVGDVHAHWQPVFEAVKIHNPAAVILLGDLGLVRSLKQTVNQIAAWGISVRWIPGNHDCESSVAYDDLWTDAADLSLHGRIGDVDGRRVAGLGGVFRGRVWYPKEGDEEATVRTRGQLMAHKNLGNMRFRDGVPLRHRDTILPEDVLALSEFGCADVLVTHEAPTCHEHGFGAIDNLALDLRVRLVVHGHHHRNYCGVTRDGIRVVGLGKASVLFVPTGEAV
jgi:predicted phosphodiesterase